LRLGFCKKEINFIGILPMAAVINYLVSIAFMVYAVLVVQQKARETPGFKVFGMTASTFIRLIYFGIALFGLLIIGYFVSSM
jgi:hypothetical protein